MLDGTKVKELSRKTDSSSESEKTTENQFEDIEFEGLGEISPETRKYILHLQSRLASVKKVCYILHRGTSLDPFFPFESINCLT